MEIDSADAIVNRPMGRFARTNPIYFQITQPGNSTVTPLYQSRQLCANRGGLLYKSTYLQILSALG
jgi:hypothetical protein